MPTPRRDSKPGDRERRNRQAIGRGPWSRAIIAAALLMAFGAAARSARPASTPHHPVLSHVPPSATDRLLFLVSGEDDGYLEPCGCSSPQIGGLPRRATVIAGHPGAIALDNGDWVEDVGRQAELKAGATAHLLAAMKYTACNLGEHDYALGYPLLTLYQQRYHLPLLATNVMAEGGKSAFEPAVRIVRAGRRITIFGEMSPSFADAISGVNPLLTVEDPAAALEKAHDGAPADLSILLYHGPAGEASALAGRFPWLSLVITAHDGEEPQSIPTSPGLPPLLSVGTRARFLGRAEAENSSPQSHRAHREELKRGRHKAEKQRGKRFEDDAPRTPYPVTGIAYPAPRTQRLLLLSPLSLGPHYSDSAVARKILTEYQDQVVAEDLLAQVPKAPLQGNWFAGSAACATCHTSAYRIWARSGHSHAYTDLIRAGHSRDPDCVGCHVVGLNSQGGFTSFAKTPQFAEVGCETCHGPQGLHSVGKGPPPAHLSRAMCVTCHNPDQSPHFNLNTYWPKVAH